jgi:hypothetical protein
MDFANHARGCKVHHHRDLMLGKNTRERRFVEEICYHKRAADKSAMPRGKIVINNRLIPGRDQRATGMRADIARAAGDEDG